MDLMDLKQKILAELMEDIDENESEKLKPKAAMSITSVHPGDDGDSGIEGHGLAEGDDKEDDDDLKMLLDHYLSSHG